MVNKSLKCSTWMQSQKRQNDLCSFPRQTIQYQVIQAYAPTCNTEEAEVEWFYEDLQDLLELTPPKDVQSRRPKSSFYCLGYQSVRVPW